MTIQSFPPVQPAIDRSANNAGGRGRHCREWIEQAVRRIEADFTRSADTHLLPVPMPRFPGIALYLKDESSHPTGSLKHRLARSLFLHALCSGWIGPDTAIVEASSGSTAVSEAYFARMLGLRFIAVVPRSTAPAKIAAIAFHGGETHFVDGASQAYETAERLAAELGGHYMNQFTFAERATDWRGNNSLAEAIYSQMALEPHPVPRWIVCGAGTGGTSATLGRFIRYNRHPTRVCVADPERSVFHRHWLDRSVRNYDGPCSLIEGIGRPRVEASFLPDVVDRMIAVADEASIAATRFISAHIGKACGGSTGTNIWACMQLIQELAQAGEQGSVVSIICDHGDRYKTTYFDDEWLEERACAHAPFERQLATFFTE